MKLKQFAILAMSAMIIIGCSRNALDEPIIELTDLETKRSEMKETLKEAFKIEIKGAGIYSIMNESSCPGLVDMKMEGISYTNLFGEIKTYTEKCTDFKGTNIIKGMHIMKNGDALFFKSEVSGVDERGIWTMYNYYDGTGKFKDLSGQIKMYSKEANGNYENQGAGILIFNNIFAKS